MVRSGRMLTAIRLGNCVLLQVRAMMVAAQAATRGEAVSLSRALNGAVLFKLVVFVNYRSCKLFFIVTLIWMILWN